MGLPSRITVAVGACIKASRSSFLFAIHSWMMPIAELAIRGKPKSPSAMEPAKMTTTKRAPSTALKRVKTFARKISLKLREVFVSATFVCPAATRSATSADDKPLVFIRG